MKRQLSFHVLIIREALENTVTAGKIIGRKVRGRSREMLLGDLKLWHGGSSTVQLIWNSRGGGGSTQILGHVLNLAVHTGR